MSKYVIALKNIIENATGDHPAFSLAQKGQKLLFLGTSDRDTLDYRVQDIKQEYGSFHVTKDEVQLLDDDTKDKICLKQ